MNITRTDVQTVITQKLHLQAICLIGLFRICATQFSVQALYPTNLLLVYLRLDLLMLVVPHLRVYPLREW